jgi:hypothetical protein
MHELIEECLSEFKKGNLYVCQTPSGTRYYGPSSKELSLQAPADAQRGCSIFRLVMDCIRDPEDADALIRFFNGFGKFIHMAEKRSRNSILLDALKGTDISLQSLGAISGLGAGYLRNVLRGVSPIGNKNLADLLRFIEDYKRTKSAPKL